MSGMSVRARTTALAVPVLACLLTACTGGTPPLAPSTPASTSSTSVPVVVAPAFGDGHYFAGVAIPEGFHQDTGRAVTVDPGSYRATGDVKAGCYWWIMPADEGTDSAHAAYGHADSGRPTVQLDAGAWWQVWGCGTTWTKVVG